MEGALTIGGREHLGLEGGSTQDWMVGALRIGWGNIQGWVEGALKHSFPALHHSGQMTNAFLHPGF